MKSFFDGTLQKKLKRRAIVVGAYKKSENHNNQNNRLDEIISLSRTAGGKVVGSITQYVERFNPSTLIGEGKVEELTRLVKEKNADLVVFDTLLSASQQMNLEKNIKTQVIDRPGLILDIFALHARTRESKIQVELAQFEYLLPRLAKGWKHLERQEGSIGTRGPGETQLETDRRLIRLRIRDLKKKIKNIEGERLVQRKRRKGLFNVCLVGYTNAGKSTVFNLLTGEDITAANYLFATLDSTTRRLDLSNGNKILLSDTVGFIKRLPVSLVAPFKSTLFEASSADLLLHVIDIADEDFEEKISTVNSVLNDLGCGDIPVIHLFNKIDKFSDPEMFRLLLSKYSDARFISAVSKEGINRFLESLENYLEKSKATIIADIHPADGGKLSILRSFGQVIDSVDNNGVLKVKIRLPKVFLGKLNAESIEYQMLDDENGD